jgi:hypothetical protein
MHMATEFDSFTGTPAETVENMREHAGETAVTTFPVSETTVETTYDADTDRFTIRASAPGLDDLEETDLTGEQLLPRLTLLACRETAAIASRDGDFEALFGALAEGNEAVEQIIELGV